MHTKRFLVPILKQSVNMFDQLATIICQKSSLASLGLLIHNIVNGQTVDNLLLHVIIRTKAVDWLQVICLVPHALSM